MLEIGSIIDGKYKILSKIGQGGMSTVYLAINEKANKPWAIKEVRKTGVKDFEIVRQSLLVEIELLRKLKHPGLPSIIDIIDQGENFLIVMDYIEGNTLGDIIQEKGVLSQEDVVGWAIQLCDVLDYLHTRKPPIIYRDMKPSNIMLRSDGSVVLIDFGTAREFKERSVADTTCLGTQGYAAPEQFGGMGQSDARTDIYSLGATLYHLVTGHNPTQPPYEMYPITHWNANLSTGLEKIILKCTQRNPEDRFQSAKDLRYALEHFRDLDVAAVKTYKNRIAAFGVTAGLAAAMFAGSIGMNIAASGIQEDDYAYYMNAAQKSTSTEDTIDYYLKAVATDCTQKDAYIGLMEVFSEDGVFDNEEEDILLKMTISVDKYLQKFKTHHPDEYADLCYDIGNTYWFYYEHEENRQSNAVSWFQSAMEYYETDETKNMEWKRSKIYVEIGNFYKKIIPAQINGTDIGMYGKYWNNLMELKKMNDENPDRDLITLRFYEEIVTRTTEYARYLQEDGIELSEIESTFASMEEDMSGMEKGANQNVLNEIERLKRLIENSDEMITSSYKGGKVS